jgi:hypothetical protein
MEINFAVEYTGTIKDEVGMVYRTHCRDEDCIENFSLRTSREETNSKSYT